MAVEKWVSLLVIAQCIYCQARSNGAQSYGLL
jgi:hypothetical protein